MPEYVPGPDNNPQTLAEFNTAIANSSAAPTDYSNNLIVTVNQRIKVEDRIYEVTTAGVTAGTGDGPTHTSGEATDGTAVLEWYGWELDTAAIGAAATSAAAGASSVPTDADGNPDLAAIGAATPAGLAAAQAMISAANSQIEAKES